jgi:hypothetical protein
MSDKPDPIEFYGVLALQHMLHCGTRGIHRKLGPPDGTLRIGCMEVPIWLAERALSVKFGEIPNMTWFTTNEACRYVGVKRSTFKRIAPELLGFMVSGNPWSSSLPIWTEAQCLQVRRQIKAGDIKVRASSLSKPLLGIGIVPARHRLVYSQSSETIEYRKAHPFEHLRV